MEEFSLEPESMYGQIKENSVPVTNVDILQTVSDAKSDSPGSSRKIGYSDSADGPMAKNSVQAHSSGTNVSIEKTFNDVKISCPGVGKIRQGCNKSSGNKMCFQVLVILRVIFHCFVFLQSCR